MRDRTEPPVWRRLYDAPGFVHETVDHRGRAWRMWFADTDAPGDPHPRGWRLAPLATLDQTAFVSHTGDGREFDAAAELIAADEAARDLRDHTRTRRPDGEHPPAQARIQLLDETAPTSLHRHLPGQQHAEAVAITLNQDTGVLAARIFDDTLPDRTVSWAIPCVTTAAANRVLQDVARLVPPLLASTPAVPYEVHSPAERAHRRIRAHLASAFSDHDLVLGMYAGEWFEKDPASSGITARTRDRELAAWASTYENNVASGRWRQFFPRGLDIGLCRHVVLRGALLWARTYRDLLREQPHPPRRPRPHDRAEHRLP
ncbi:hypothetical protein G3I59_32130 [Amycolatopsis rubida]|uniref:Uncharacterized protein n=1 Tax=Amycolatopsis rubida TaxID=112413 RepID=A0ABX0BM60_9PSEU|nr:MULTISPECIES: hypothetical protein [Amycolatopsis]MYW90510.1 hypothetical protein [Amycolatopsis rubida]MYW95122.1 hypothetical protein [Amycolatopsis rubida]NEC55490.1 hypothetical protein [Amycolatopsis rubida]NEC60109.1 hypothetical protein [Amycolatopsis rubida]OAP24995.1 hypothetical protein A4R44_04064 [Amycolatopsis sp. M39]